MREFGVNLNPIEVSKIYQKYITPIGEHEKFMANFSARVMMRDTATCFEKHNQANLQNRFMSKMANQPLILREWNTKHKVAIQTSISCSALCSSVSQFTGANPTDEKLQKLYQELIWAALDIGIHDAEATE